MKPSVRLCDLPARVQRTGAFRECQSTAWGHLPKNGDSTVYLGNRGEKLVAHTHSVMLFKHFPDIGPGYYPVLDSLICN